jgi:hypothetical protein
MKILQTYTCMKRDVSVQGGKHARSGKFKDGLNA